MLLYGVMLRKPVSKCDVQFRVLKMLEDSTAHRISCSPRPGSGGWVSLRRADSSQDLRCRSSASSSRTRASAVSARASASARAARSSSRVAMRRPVAGS